VTILVDTSVMVDHLRGHPGARSALADARASEKRLIASVLSKVEILAGVRPAEEQATRELFHVFEWISVDDALAERAGALAQRFVRSHPGVDPVDYAIAATAEHFGAELWTGNAKHFPMFPELPDPYSEKRR
jgi:predicted nucleic acid-binding protein